MAITSLNSINKLIFVTVKCCVSFEVKTESLNIVSMNFGFKWLTTVKMIPVSTNEHEQTSEE
jgi:hypothetical protein